MPVTATGFFMRSASTVVPSPPCTMYESISGKSTPKSARSTSSSLPSVASVVALASSSLGILSACLVPT